MTSAFQSSGLPLVGVEDLLRVEFDVVPIEKGRVNYFTGHLIRGAFLAMLSETDSELLEKLHDGPSVRPYSVAPIRLPHHGDLRGKLWEVRPGKTLRFRLSCISKKVSSALLKAALDTEGRTLKIAETECVVKSLRFQSEGFADLVRETTQSSVHEFWFLSPTMFQVKSETFPMLFPLPVYVFGSLGSLWNRFAPSETHFEMDDFMEEVRSDVCVTKHALRTAQVRIKGHIPVTGFVGTARFKVAREGSRQLQNMVSLLTALAGYSGVGAKRSFGFGAVDTKSQSSRDFEEGPDVQGNQ